jgi:hypothetical protein
MGINEINRQSSSYMHTPRKERSMAFGACMRRNEINLMNFNENINGDLSSTCHNINDSKTHQPTILCRFINALVYARRAPLHPDRLHARANFDIPEIAI